MLLTKEKQMSNETPLEPALTADEIIADVPELPEGFAEGIINPEFEVLPEDIELTVQQKVGLENLNQLFKLRMELVITAILDGLAEKFRKEKAKAERKVENKKGKRIYQFDAGYLKAYNEIFDSLHNFLYTVKETDEPMPDTMTPEDAEFLDSVAEVVNNKGEVNE